MNRLFALWGTTVGKKVAMAATGIVMILFLISHMISNVLIFRNPEHLEGLLATTNSVNVLIYLYINYSTIRASCQDFRHFPGST